MPFYEYHCSCKSHTLYRKIADRDAASLCQDCGGQLLRQQITAPSLKLFSPYRSPIDGSWIDSPNQRREDLAKSGCVEWEPGIKQDLPRLRKEAAEKNFKPIEKALETTFRDMVASGRA